MAYYFLSISRRSYRSTGDQEVSEWRPTPPTKADPVKARSDLPAYDMENFPKDKWDSVA